MLLAHIQKTNNFEEVYTKLVKPGQIVHGLTNSAKSFVLANLLDRSEVPMLFVVQNHHEAQIYFQEIRNLSAKPVYYFAVNEISPYDQINSDITVLNHQYQIFETWAANKNSLVVMTYKALSQLYISKETFTKDSLVINKSLEIAPQDLAKKLVRLGYTNETMVETRGQFSHRGDIFDIYPIVGEAYRIEFFGDEVENIRSFSTSSQRSVAAVNEFTIHPRYLIQRDEDDKLEEILKKEFEVQSSKLSDAAKDSIEALAQSELTFAQETLCWEGVEHYRGLLDQKDSNLFEYLPERLHIAFDEWQDLVTATEKWQENIEKQYKDSVDAGKLLPVKDPLHYGFNDIVESLKSYPQKLYIQTMIEMADGVSAEAEVLSYELESFPAERFASKVESFIEYIRKSLREKKKLIIYSEQPQRVLGILKEWDVPSQYLDTSSSEAKETNLKLTDDLTGVAWIQRDGTEEGFKMPVFDLVVLTDRELFGRSRQAIARQKTRKQDQSTKDVYTDIAQLKENDYVVHYKHGVGIYKGTEFVELDNGRIKQEYLAIEYASESRILIPVDQVNMLSRFRVTGETKPRLSKLGGQEWERTKKKVKKSVKKIAQDLINLYAMRAKQTGYKYPMDTPWQIEMEDAFPYSETQDQLNAVAAIKGDMESEKLLDRLICGDAGFGKTEVVLRAVFKAVMDGKQVAILVPTTVLAQQHFNVFKDRFAPYPIRVGLLCRFKTAKEQKETAERLKIGECDVVIGTHRLLQKDIRFKNLGMLVIDEEQRFGVAHKEKLKSLRQDLDVITMSATPIPRTLHMALSGIKDVSLISTAPINRLPVKTFVGEYKNTVIRSAILHELERGGQVFFVHNRIETIERVAFEIQELVPEARVRFAHGKMQDRELEDAMFAFINNEYDVLVCTTIIETGLDIANANTILIDNANAFGLSQLYQLRGRVGRSDNQAYAYFLYHPEKDISDTARKRLKAIRELTNLGAGYQVALRDMEIRGVGNIFGAEQHGQMIAVGFDLYCKMLSDTVEEMKGNIEADDLKPDPTIDLKVNAYFPQSWMPDEKQRMNEYRRLSDIRNSHDMDLLISEWEDRFGRLPDEVKSLIELVRVKILAKKAGIGTITQEGAFIKIFINLRLQAWLPVQRGLDSLWQTRSSFKPGTLGSRNSQSYISLKIEGLDQSTIIEGLLDIITKLHD